MPTKQEPAEELPGEQTVGSPQAWETGKPGEEEEHRRAWEPELRAEEREWRLAAQKRSGRKLHQRLA